MKNYTNTGGYYPWKHYCDNAYIDTLLLKKLPVFDLDWNQDLKVLWFGVFHHLRISGEKHNREPLPDGLWHELIKQKEKNSRYRFRIRELQNQIRRLLK